MSILPQNVNAELQKFIDQETVKVSPANPELLKKIEELENTLLGIQYKRGVSDTWCMDWIEKNPRKLQCNVYKGRPVWYTDAEHDFPTARAAIGHAIGLDIGVISGNTI